MITTKDLESLGWKNITIGGTKNTPLGAFTKKGCMFIIFINAPEFEVILINKIKFGKSTETWKGIPKDIQDLKRILVETGADMEWLPELRDQKINDILDEKTL